MWVLEVFESCLQICLSQWKNYVAQGHPPFLFIMYVCMYSFMFWSIIFSILESQFSGGKIPM